MKEATYTVMYYGLKLETQKEAWWNLPDKGGFTILPEFTSIKMTIELASKICAERNSIKTQKCRHIVAATYNEYDYWFVSCPKSEGKKFERDLLTPVDEAEVFGDKESLQSTLYLDLCICSTISRLVNLGLNLVLNLVL